MPEPRTFKLRIGESGEWCQEGTLVKVDAADLEQLCARVGERLGLIGVQVEIFDSDFDEWVGPFVLDDVPAVASVRVRAQRKQHPPSPTADKPADIAPVAAASGDGQARLATQLQSFDKGARNESPGISLTQAQRKPPSSEPQSQPEPQPVPGLDPIPYNTSAVGRQDVVGSQSATAEEANPPATAVANMLGFQEPHGVRSPPAQSSVDSSVMHSMGRGSEPAGDLGLNSAEEPDLTTEELAELASLYPHIVSPVEDISSGSPDEHEAPAAVRLESPVPTSQAHAGDDDLRVAAKDATLGQATHPKPNLDAEIAMRERMVRESFDSVKRRAQNEAETLAAAADWRGLGQWVKDQTEAVTEQRILAEAAVEVAVKEMWTAIKAQEDASSAIADARHQAQRKGLVQRRAGTISGRASRKFAPMWAEVKAGCLTWLTPADAAAAEAAGLKMSAASHESPVLLTQCSVRYLSSLEASKAQLPTPHVFRLELATTGVDDSKSGPSWLLALETAEDMNGWIQVVKCNSGLAQRIHELQERKEKAASTATEYQTRLVPAAEKALTLAFLMEKRDMILSGLNESMENARPSVSGATLKQSAENGGPQRSTSPTSFGSPSDQRGSLVVVQPSTRFAVGHADAIGKRPTMEDCSTVHGCFRGFATEDYFAVFDGHGGIEVAEYAAQYMHQHLEAALAPLGPRTPSEKQMDAAFTAAFAATNQFHSLVPDSSVARSCGCTVVVAMVVNSMLHVANAGDARAVLCRAQPDNAVAPASGIRLSVDHKPGLAEERQRIEAGGGQVICRRGVDRVEGFLAVSRALGDLGLAPHVSCTPFTSSTKLGPLDEFLILACDGVWDVLSDDDAAAIVSTRARLSPEKGGGVDGAAQALVDASLRKGSTDNITVQVIWLHKRSGEKQQQSKATDKSIAVGSVADAMAIMDEFPAPASTAVPVVKKKRKIRTIGVTTENTVQKSAALPGKSQGDGVKHTLMDEDCQHSDPIFNGRATSQSDDQHLALDNETELRLEPMLAPRQTSSPQEAVPAVDPLLLKLATTSPPIAEHKGGSGIARSKEAYAAVQKGDELLSAGDPVGAVRAYTEALELGTAEHLEVGRSLSTAQLLLSQNLAREAVRAQDAAVLSQLIRAAGARAPELVNSFFDANQGVTLAYFAAQENDHKTLKLLLGPVASSTADTGIIPPRSSRGESNQNALMAGGQHSSCLADRPANNGGTPLFVASKLGNAMAVNTLISGGCSVDAVVSSPGQPIDGLSALLIATRQGHCDVVQQLLGARADPNQRMADGTRPVHLATAHGHGSIIRLLSNAGADMNARKDSKKQATPLLSAAKLLNADAVEALIDGGADLFRQVYSPSDQVQTTLQYAFGVALKASRSRGSPKNGNATTAATAKRAGQGRASDSDSAEQMAAKRVMEVLHRANRRPVLSAHQRLSLAKLLPPAGTNDRYCQALSRVFNRVVTRMPLPTCQLTVVWSQQMASHTTGVTPTGARPVYQSALPSRSAQNTVTELSVSLVGGLHSNQQQSPPSVSLPQRPSDGSVHDSSRHETRHWQDVAPHEWSTELVRQWSAAVLHTNATSVVISEVSEGSSAAAHSSKLVSGGLAAARVDGEGLLGIPSFRVLHSVIGNDIPAGPVLKFWGILQQLQMGTGIPSNQGSAAQFAAEKQWEEIERGIMRLEARRKALTAAVSQASMELHTDRDLRAGIEAELSQTRSQVEWIRAQSSHLRTPTRPQKNKLR